MDLDSRRELNKGLGDGMSRSFDIALTPVLFALAGLGLDAWIGTTPAFTLGLFVFAIVGVFIRMWYVYDLEMRRHAEKRGWG